jgi:transcriptional regulator with XRE-family HTH domain
MPNDRARSAELGAFLKARRRALHPEDLGLAGGENRRVPGLRREEVADSAAISTDYYARIEQGRRTVSVEVLESIVRALRLDREEREYAIALAGRDPRGGAEPAQQQRVLPALQILLDEITSAPALVLGPRMDILAWNTMAAALLLDFAALEEHQRNYVWLVFNANEIRQLYVDWEDVGRRCVAQLRMDAVRDPDDPATARLVDELSIKHADFRHWWAAHEVATGAGGTKVLRHPVAGPLSLRWNTYTAEVEVEQHQRLVVWTAEAGSPSADALKLLGSWRAAPAVGNSMQRGLTQSS